MSDDILVFGKGENAHSMHEKALRETLAALSKVDPTVNSSKNEYYKESIVFYGLKFCAKGVSPNPQKVKAVKDIPAPTSTSEARSLIGMLTYCVRFIPDYATLSEPICRLLCSDSKFVWRDEERALKTVKGILSDETVLDYFDTGKNTEIVVDASPVGLGTILGQANSPVEFASRALSLTKSRYSQTEREALAIVWARAHFDMYLRGAPRFVVWSDHKPLETIWQKPNAPSLRIERWGLWLQSYDLEIRHLPGSRNPADWTSRHPKSESVNSQEELLAEFYVNFMAESCSAVSLPLSDVCSAAAADKTYCKAAEFVKSGQWHIIRDLRDPEIDACKLKGLSTVRDELTAYPGLELNLF